MNGAMSTFEGSERLAPPPLVIADRFQLDGTIVGQTDLTRVYGAVDLAAPKQYRKPVVVKLAQPGSLEGEGHLRSEVGVLSEMPEGLSPYVMPILESSDGESPFVAMPRADFHLGQFYIVDEGDVDQAVRYLGQAAQGMDDLLEGAIILKHGDLAPKNIMVVDGIARVSDFGLASSVKVQGIQSAEANISREPAPGPDEEATLPTVGTWDFVAPELKEGALPDESSDVYAWSVTALRVLTRTMPIRNLLSLDEQLRQVEEAVEVNPTTALTKEVVENIRQGISRDPDIRPPFHVIAGTAAIAVNEALAA